MRTTLNIDECLLDEAKALAERERKTLARLVEEGLEMRLRNKPRQRQRSHRPALPVYQGRSGLAPGIDPRSNRSLLEAADQ